MKQLGSTSPFYENCSPKKEDGFPNISFLQHWEIMCETWLHFCNQWIVACLTFIRLREEENVENALRYIAQRRRYFSPNFKKVQYDILHQIGRFHPTPRMRYSSSSVRPTVLCIQNQPTFLVDDGMWIADDG